MILDNFRYASDSLKFFKSINVCASARKHPPLNKNWVSLIMSGSVHVDNGYTSPGHFFAKKLRKKLNNFCLEQSRAFQILHAQTAISDLTLTSVSTRGWPNPMENLLMIPGLNLLFTRSSENLIRPFSNINRSVELPG